MTINTRWIRLGLSLIGVGGVGITSWLSIKCHEKAKEKTEKKDKAMAYIPAVASGVVTAGCILGSHHLSSKEIAALTASCGYLAANRDKIKAKLVEAVGTEKAKELEAKAAVDTKKELNKEIKGAKTKTVVEQTGHGNVHFVEDMFGREFFCSLQHVEWAEKMLNHLYTHDEKTDYNTFYELLGLKKTLSGWEYGWPRNEQFYDPESFGYSTDAPILFENTPCEDEDGNLCYVISVRMTPPVNGYLELED